MHCLSYLLALAAQVGQNHTTLGITKHILTGTATTKTIPIPGDIGLGTADSESMSGFQNTVDTEKSISWLACCPGTGKTKNPTPR